MSEMPVRTRPFRSIASATEHIRQAHGILLYVLLVGVVGVALAVTTVTILDRLAIEKTAAEYRRSEFLRAAEWVSTEVSKSGGIANAAKLSELFRTILNIRMSIRQLEAFAIGPDRARLLLSSHPDAETQPLSADEQNAAEEGRSIARFDGSSADRVWVITAPLVDRGHVIGALRGRFSIWKFDLLILRQLEVAVLGASAAAVLLCAAFVLLIKYQVHRPIARLLEVMRSTSAGDLSVQAPLIGPSDIQELAAQFNRMVSQVRAGLEEKERLLSEIQALNQSLEGRIVEAVSELRRTGQMLADAQVQAERSEKLAALGELSAVMAHELGNPLNAIAGRLHLLNGEDDSRERLRHLDIVKSEIGRMETTIRHILDSTHIKVRHSAVDLNKIIRDVLELVAPMLGMQGVDLKIDLLPGLPLIAGDRNMIRGMAMNLITNARHAMPNGGELTIETRESDDRPVAGFVALAGARSSLSHGVRFSVRDTGHGIPPDQLQRIFEPFFTTRRAEGGTGLGLMICRRAVSYSGGRLVVESRPECGTTFTIDLPISEESAGDSRHA